MKSKQISYHFTDTLVECLAKMSRAPYLVSLELPGLGSDELLGKLLTNCKQTAASSFFQFFFFRCDSDLL